MQIHLSQSYRVIVLAALLALTGCIGVPDPMIAGGGVSEDGSFETDARLTAGDSECLALGEPKSDVHAMMFDRLNDYRIEHGLSPLIYSTKLEEAAELHVQDLWQRGYFSHTNPEGEGPAERALAAGFCHKYVGENLAAGQRTVDGAMQAWINSPSHNENMLHEPYVYVGMGYTEDPSGRRYWAQSFAYDRP